MSFPTYAHYKDSGVEWLGEVPAHWEVIRLANLFQQMAEEGTDDLPILSVSIHSGVSDKEMNDEEMDRKVTRSDDLSKYKRVMPGDLVYNMMRAWQGGFGTVTIAGMVSPAYVVARPIKIFVTDFIEQQLRTPNAVEEMRRNSRGVTDFRLRLYWEEFKTLQVVLPPIDDQRRIMEELNGETSKIDALITEQRTLIDLLKEKRQAVISHAVTKGLDAGVAMKDSGVEWLGEVPAHWEVHPLKHVVAFRSGGTPDKGNIDYWDGDIPWASAKDLKVDDLFDTADHITEAAVVSGAASLVPAKSILVVVRGMILARIFPVVMTQVPMAINQDLKAVIPGEHIHADYMAWLLRGSESETLSRLDEAGHGTKALRMDAWGAMKMPVPSVAEQKEIVTFINQETNRLDVLTAEAQTTIALLQERRSALISAAVTGKIDVRQHATEAA